MPFPATSGILLPSDFATIHRVFSSIVAEPWFTPSDERRNQFAAEVVDAYRQGIVEFNTLSDHCWTIAWNYYGNGGVE